MRKTFSPQFKATIALEALKSEKTVNELAALHAVHPTQINEWKRFVTEQISALFTDKRTREGKTYERQIDELHRIIGQRDVELEWLKKKLCIPSS